MFQFLAVSRAGYLHSSANTGRTPQEQDRSYAELLDHGGISRAAILGLSGGALSALRFAQDFPGRCWALVLISSISLSPPPLPPIFQLAVRMQGVSLRFDPFWVLIYSYRLGLLLRSNGLQPEQVEMVLGDSHLRSVVRGIFQPIKSSSPRREGVKLDGAQIEALAREAGYEIKVPTFICHAQEDPLASPTDAAQLASGIPGAEYLALPDGGHLFFVVHNRRVIPAIERFLLTHAPAEAAT